MSSKGGTVVAVAFVLASAQLFGLTKLDLKGFLISLESSSERAKEGGNTEQVPLLDWEVESAVNRTCQPPNGIPKYCCLGSTSKGGGVRFFKEECTRGMVRADV